MKTSLFNDTIENIRAAADIIRYGGLVAFPTETVYGIAKQLARFMRQREGLQIIR